MIRKEGVLLLVLLLAVVSFSQMGSSTLGINPAKIEKNFNPGMEEKFTFSVNSDKPGKEIVVYKKGSLKEYASLSKEEIRGGGRFNVKVDLPEDLGEPGEHELIVGAKEKIDKELVTVGTSLAVQSVVEYFVPYPGKYLDLEFNPKNANKGTTIPMIMEINNRGKQNVSMKPRIEILDGNKTIETIRLSRRELPQSDKIRLKGTFNTSGHKPGNYKAKAIVDYAGKSAIEKGNFTIGHLFVDVTGQTRNLTMGGIKNFRVEAKSEWGKKAEGVYADVEIIENISSRKVFRTTPDDIEPWQKTNLTGYFDTTNMTSGTYDTKIFLNYGDKEDVHKGQVNIYNKEKETKISTPIKAAVSIIILIAIIFIILKILKRNENEKN